MTDTGNRRRGQAIEIQPLAAPVWPAALLKQIESKRTTPTAKPFLLVRLVAWSEQKLCIPLVGGPMDANALATQLFSNAERREKKTDCRQIKNSPPDEQDLGRRNAWFYFVL